MDYTYNYFLLYNLNVEKLFFDIIFFAYSNLNCWNFGSLMRSRIKLIGITVTDVFRIELFAFKFYILAIITFCRWSVRSVWQKNLNPFQTSGTRAGLFLSNSGRNWQLATILRTLLQTIKPKQLYSLGVPWHIYKLAEPYMQMRLLLFAAIQTAY